MIHAPFCFFLVRFSVAFNDRDAVTCIEEV